jgi:ABC-type branched-subunit amino acid transport system substrate-binding protein
MLIVDIAFDLADQYMETHVSILKRSGADIFVFAGAPAVAAKVIRIAADLNWASRIHLGQRSGLDRHRAQAGGSGKFHKITPQRLEQSKSLLKELQALH